MTHLNLDQDEKVLLISRRYFLTLLKQVLVAFFLMVMPFFLMFPLFSWGKWGIVFFVYSVSVGIIVLVEIYVVWHFNTLTITTKRVIKTKQHGFFDRRVSEMLVSRINDVSHHIKGFWGTLLRCGTLHIVAGNGDTVLDFPHMKNPSRALRILNKLLQVIPQESIKKD
ncbi:PH domain-containing protein [Candidatus Uhrbacteria bacterium]|nr:PH domain-containing protein [Candidatus Uhrbacteria bacterium]